MPSCRILGGTHNLVKMQGVTTAVYLLAVFLGMILSQHLGNLSVGVWSASLGRMLFHSAGNHPVIRLAFPLTVG